MKKRISVPYIDQTTAYPTGCESISAVMLLHYLGYNISPEHFIDHCLVKRDLEFHQGVLYGPHPDDAFIGSPYNMEAGSYGCYAGCLAAAMNRAAEGKYRFAAQIEKKISWLIENYIEKEIPVIFWATLKMEPSFPGKVWHLLGRTGEFQWKENEHCLLLVGYDREKYYFNDPWQNAGCVGYPKDLVEQRYKEMGMQIVVPI